MQTGSACDGRSGYAISLLALVGALLVPASASAAVETFHRFEAVATASYTITEDCADGSTTGA